MKIIRFEIDLIKSRIEVIKYRFKILDHNGRNKKMKEMDR